MNRSGFTPLTDLPTAGPPLLPAIAHPFDLLRARLVDAKKLEVVLEKEHAQAVTERIDAQNAFNQYLDQQGVR